MNAANRLWWTPFKEIDGIEIVHVDLAIDEARESEALAWLDASEKDRWGRFLVDRPRNEFALCRAALRIHLCEKIGCANESLSFGYGEHGKPFAIANGSPVPLSFNVSHSGRHGLLAFASSGEVGVDVEERKRRKDIDGIGETVFGRNERSALSMSSGLAKVNLFFKLWTIKEALIKVIGTGFSLDPSTFEVPPSMLHGAALATFRFPHLPATSWRISDFGEERFAAAIAYEENRRA